MTRRSIFGLACMLLLAMVSADATHEEEFVVIVNPSNHFDTLSRSKLTFLFLRKVSRWPWGAEVDPIDLPQHDLVRAEFTRQVLGTTEDWLANYWIDQKTTRGVNPPVQVHDVAAAKALVASHPGAIAYVPASAVDATVKVIKVEP